MKPGLVATTVVKHFRESYALDYRSLAVYRVLVALIVLADLVTRFGDATTLYSDAGILPRTSAIPILATDRWSLLFLQGSPEYVHVFIVIGIVAAAMMLVGWRTRTATIILWVVVVSLQARNNHVAYGADTLIRLTLFWGMFLPLGAMWSFDRQHKPHPATNAVASLATFGLLVQNAYMYVFTAMLKEGPHWRQDNDAVYYALGMRDLSTWLGEWIFLNAPASIFTAMTIGTLWMEFAVPIMLLMPLRAPWLRIIAIAIVLVLHLGIGSIMSVGLFPAISIASILVVLPSGFWRYALNTGLLRRVRRLSPGTLVHGSDDSQLEVGDRRPIMTMDRHVLRFQNAAVPDSARISRYIVSAVCALSIFIGLLWNISTVSSFDLPDPLRRTAVATGLYQNWGMFAPDPRPVSRWFIVEGDTASGDNVDLMVPLMESDYSLRQPPVWDQSDNVLLQSEHWRKYFFAISSRENDGLKMAGYICRNWNAENSGDDRLETVRFTVASSATLPNNERAEPAYQQVGLWFCN